MPDLGKAYVQIVPSAEGISGSISKVMSQEAISAGRDTGKLFSGNLFAAITGGIAALGIGKAVSASIMEGANLEQSIGGIETLYKGAADAVRKYADEAFKSAGMSANDYMETVTGFSAGLITSMGGDTVKAGEIANQTMIDMSDNANKMGTDMESIKFAYQGFAKQNYTIKQECLMSAA